MDAAGKDGAIRQVMSGVNPQGCQVFSFKHPSATELEHDFHREILRSEGLRAASHPTRSSGMSGIVQSLMSCAPSVPSTTRWSQVSVTVMIVAISILAERTTGRFRV